MLRDIVQRWPQDKTDRISLLTDCASAVTGFEKEAEAFVHDMKEAGVKLCTAMMHLIN